MGKVYPQKLKKNYRFIELLIGLLIFSISTNGQNPNLNIPLKDGLLLFNSGFEAGSKIVPGADPFVSDDAIIGKDMSVPPPNDWIEDFSVTKRLTPFRFQYQQGDTTKRKLRIVPDPVNPDNNVLSFWVSDQWVNASGNTVGRIQANIRTTGFGSEGDGSDGFKEFYQKNRLFFHEDVSILEDYPGKGSFFTFLEIWNNHDSQPFGFRIKLGIGKNSSDPGQLYFTVSGQDYRNSWTTIWGEFKSTLPVPFGEWITMECYVKEGNKQNGRFWLAITREGREREIVFDVNNFTHNSTDPNPNGFTFWNPLKVYITDKNRMEFIKSHGKALQLYFDDLEVWVDNFPSFTPPDLKPIVNGVSKYTDNINGFAEATSNKTGMIYFVKYGLDAATIAELDSLVNANLGRKENVNDAGIPVIIYTKGLPGGYYQYYAVDMENRISLPSPGWVSIDQSGPVTGLDTPIFKQSFSGWQHNRQIIVEPGNDQSFSLEIYTITGQLLYHEKNLSGIQTVNLNEKKGVLIIRKISESEMNVVKLVVN